MNLEGRLGKIIMKGTEDLPILTFLISLFGLTYYSSTPWQLSCNVLCILFSFYGIYEALSEAWRLLRALCKKGDCLGAFCVSLLLPPLAIAFIVNVTRFIGVGGCISLRNADTFQLLPYPHCDGHMQ